MEYDYGFEDIDNPNVHVKNFDDLKAKKENGLSYDELKAELGGIDGVRVIKTNKINSYIWYNSNGGSINATFSVPNGECISIAGYNE